MPHPAPRAYFICVCQDGALRCAGVCIFHEVMARATGLAARFAAQCARGALKPDKAQQHALIKLEGLRHDILSHTQAVAQYESALTAWRGQVAELQEQQRLSEARERERIANLPFYERWLLRLREMQAADSSHPARQAAAAQQQHAAEQRAAGPHAAGPHAAGPHAAGPRAAGPHAAGPDATPSPASSCSGSCSGGGEGGCSNKPAEPASSSKLPFGLDEAELQHPFWRTGLGSQALQRAGVTLPPESGGAAASAGAPRSEWAALPPGAPPPPERPPQPAGLFLHGSVGAGKTMLMDWCDPNRPNGHHCGPDPRPCLRP